MQKIIIVCVNFYGPWWIKDLKRSFRDQLESFTSNKAESVLNHDQLPQPQNVKGFSKLTIHVSLGCTHFSHDKPYIVN